jgi:hypothetical protein
MAASAANAPANTCIYQEHVSSVRGVQQEVLLYVWRMPSWGVSAG